MSRRLDLRSDIHGRAIEFANDIDRAFFADHPDVHAYIRPPVEHELCNPIAAADGHCLRGDLCEPGYLVFVRVFSVETGVRFRQPVVVPAGDL